MRKCVAIDFVLFNYARITTFSLFLNILFLFPIDFNMPLVS